MATITPLKHTPHTRIENTVIADMAEIGVTARRLFGDKNACKSGIRRCFPSYATIALSPAP